MNVLPVIDRELRTAARQSLTYILRVLGVIALLVVLALFGVQGSIGPEVGGQLFRYLHRALFAAIWVLAPLLTADAISRERREGTLPLLFLTPLRPRDIVYAKGLAHGLRAFTLWLAVLPVLMVSIVAGGVGWREVVISALVNFSAICLATGAGLVASSLARAWTRALTSAACLAFLFLLIFFTLIPLLVVGFSGPIRSGFFPWRDEWTSLMAYGFALALNYDELWQNWVAPGGRGSGGMLWAFVTLALLALLGLLLLVRLAAWNVRRTWQEQPPPPRVLWLQQKLVQPVLFQNVLRRWLRWELQHNPIGWLEQRSWSGRLVIWSWFAVVTCLYSSLFANFHVYQGGFHALQTFLAWLLVASIALSAAGSFRREKETGVLELLLVAPLSEARIIAGRIRGLWTQFLPAVVLLFSVWIYCASFLGSPGEMRSVVFYLVTFATLPVVGLYFSLAKANFFSALAWTLLVEIAVPNAALRVFTYFSPFDQTWQNASEPSAAEVLVLAVIQILVAATLVWRLLDNLKRRKFALSTRPA
jgi:ABC-type transport system involved in multi-copper enzyme maturation permease subunit